jgi:hypothetical protein
MGEGESPAGSRVETSARLGICKRMLTIRHLDFLMPKPALSQRADVANRNC